MRELRGAWSRARSFRLGLMIMLLAAGSALAGGEAAAQVPDLQPGATMWEIRLADGTAIVGVVVEATAERVTLETPAGTRVNVARSQIRAARVAEGRIVDGAYWFEDPNHTRLLLISPTGRSLTRGEGYVSAFWVVFPFAAYGVTDRFTIAGGTPILPMVIGRIIYLAPKYRVFSQPGLDVAVGAISLFLTEKAASGTAGIGYTVGTYGSSDRSVTAGAGWAYAVGEGESWASNRPAVMLGGDTRIGRTVKLVTENFVVPGESGTLLSGGVRLFGERIAVDLGLAGFVGDGEFAWVPAGNFVYNFGGRR
jgi:hypothetical protein